MSITRSAISVNVGTEVSTIKPIGQEIRSFMASGWVPPVFSGGSGSPGLRVSRSIMILCTNYSVGRMLKI